jgi:NDP-4-keto-2,6-dideoxyhexose 3-C-methyltransferase
MLVYRAIEKCRICGNENLESLLDLGEQALTGVFPGHSEDLVPGGPLQLVRCAETGSGESCGLVQLKHSYNGAYMYGQNYGYRSGLNRSMVEHLGALANRIKGLVSIEPGDVILDIGSNDSTLLRALHAPGASSIGMDPSGVKFREFYPPHIQLVPDFFSARRLCREVGNKKAKIVTSIAMFYDLESPLEFMREIAGILHQKGVWVLEQSYLPLMLERNAYDTICHEHVEYYAFRQIEWMASRAGLKIVDVELNDANGGSFAVTAVRADSDYVPNETALNDMRVREAELGLAGRPIYDEFRLRVFDRKEILSRWLSNQMDRQRLVLGYGASTKGNVVLQFCDIRNDRMPYIAEINCDKFGSFTPGSLIPIISEEEARAMKPAYFLVFPWHFRDNIICRERKFLRSGGTLVFPLPELEEVHGCPER